MHEFYANAYEHNNGRVRVRGQDVAFDRTSINKYYSLPNIDNDEYVTYLSDQVNYEELIGALCKIGTTWKLSHGEPVSFKANAMHQRARV